MRHETVDSQPVFQGERILLRPLRASDAGRIAHFANDKRVAEMTTTIPNPLPPGAAEAFVASASAPDRDEDVWAIDGTPDDRDELLGLISLKSLDREQSEIGYWVAPPYWNLGYASEAVGLILRMNPHANRTVFAQVFQDNPASARVLTNAGFAYLGEAEAFSVARNQNVPSWTYIRKMDV